jgi:DNA-binding beta-propeller fold protein YncE
MGSPVGTIRSGVRRRRLIRALSAGLLSSAFLGGCATAAGPVGASEPVFYPAPPAPARVQLLTSISGSWDVPGGRNWFTSFIMGREEDRPIVKPYGIGIWRDRLYVCDTTIPALIVIDLGTRRFTYLASGTAAGLSKPINITIDDDGTKYVADAVRGVLVFDADDRFVGALPTADGTKPTDVAIAGNRLYIADVDGSRVVVLDKATLAQVFTIPREDERSLRARLFSPVNLAVDRGGNLYVADMGAFRVLEFDPDGYFIRSFGTPGDGPGQFARPKGIDVDDEGLLYAVDAAAQVVQVFDPKGRLLLYFGEPREGDPPLSLPATVRLDRSLIPWFRGFAAPSFQIEYLAFVSSQYGDHKISVFGIGR